MTEISKTNLKATMDSVILSAIYDFGAQLAHNIKANTSEKDIEQFENALIGIFFEMSKFLKANDINVHAEYFKHWNQLFKDGGSC